MNKAVHYVNEATHYPINETEIAIPFNDYDDLGNVKKGRDAMKRAVEDNQKMRKYHLNMIVHMRFLSGSKSLMSPAYENKHTCYMDFGSYYKTPRWKELVNEVWKTWKQPPGVKLHWAKDMWAHESFDIEEMYGPENVNKFLKIREQLDPGGMLANDFMRKLFKLDFSKQAAPR